MAALDLRVTGVAWRLVFLLGACLMIVAIVLLLPADWRKRLGPATAAFVAAAGTLSIFLANPSPSPAPAPAPAPSPSTSPSGPSIDPQALATLIAAGPFDQTLPDGLVAGPVKPATVGDPSAASKINATQIPIEVPASSQLTDLDIQSYAEVEVYPTAKAAAQRAKSEMAFLSNVYEKPIQEQTISGFCVAVTPNGWTCGGARGNAYAETSISPGIDALTGLTQAINSALLNYASDKARLATAG